jgi:ribulose-5-phosphate 4-epimerase/fuculose-1-phosphate aldolase
MYEDLKFDLCCGARALFRAGLSVGIAGHLSIKVAPDTMIANRFGPSFGTVMPRDILTLGLDGTIKEGQGYVNDTIRLHGVIHQLNPKIVAVAHTHPPAVVTFSALRKVPDVYDQESCILAGDVGIVEEDYSGLASKEERVRPFAEGLSKYRALILPNHGAITGGENIQQAVITMLVLEGMVLRNLSVVGAARAMGVTPRPITQEVALLTKQELRNLAALGLVWEDLTIKLRATDPGLFAAREQGGK